MPIPEPEDGFTQMERIILRELILTVYLRLSDPLDKFILMATHESNYNQQEVGQMLGISQVAVSNRLEEIKTKLRKAKEDNKL